jgi:hypothetical protein
VNAVVKHRPTPFPAASSPDACLILSLSKDASKGSPHQWKHIANSTSHACARPRPHILRQAQDEEQVDGMKGRHAGCATRMLPGNGRVRPGEGPYDAVPKNEALSPRAGEGWEGVGSKTVPRRRKGTATARRHPLILPEPAPGILPAGKRRRAQQHEDQLPIFRQPALPCALLPAAHRQRRDVWTQHWVRHRRSRRSFQAIS